MAEQDSIEDLMRRRDGPWTVDGRPITNIEMHRLLEHSRDQRRKRIAARDCSDCEGPMEDGLCRKSYGKCAFLKDAEKLLATIEQMPRWSRGLALAQALKKTRETNAITESDQGTSSSTS